MPTSWPFIIVYIVGGIVLLQFVGAFLFSGIFLAATYRFFKKNR